MLEAVRDYLGDLMKPDSTAPKHRREIREAIRTYADQALQEARKREDELYYGMTGETDIVETDK